MRLCNLPILYANWQWTIMFANSLKGEKGLSNSSNMEWGAGWSHAPQYVKQIYLSIS